MIFGLVPIGVLAEEEPSVDNAGISGNQEVAEAVSVESTSSDEAVATTEAVSVSAAEDGFTYTEVAGGVSIIKYTGGSTDVIIPDALSGKTVIEIGDLAFLSLVILIQWFLNNSIVRIGKNAFGDALVLIVSVCRLEYCRLGQRVFQAVKASHRYRLTPG